MKISRLHENWNCIELNDVEFKTLMDCVEHQACQMCDEPFFHNEKYPANRLEALGTMYEEMLDFNAQHTFARWWNETTEIFVDEC